MMIALLAAEPWEAALAVATVRAVLKQTGHMHVLAPDFLASHLDDVPGLEVEPLALAPGFPTIDRVRAALIDAAKGRPFYWLPAGSLPEGGADGETPPTLGAPVHAPPVQRKHRRDQIGGTAVWRLDTGQNYFQALTALPRDTARPAWRQYGPAAPVFAVNTNRFSPVPTAAADRYFILGSGLIGLRAVLESDPANGAEVVVFDINPAQLDWITHLLAQAARQSTLRALIDSYQAVHHGARVRQVAPHEEANMALQSEWYAGARHGIAALAKKMRWRFVQLDLWTAPHELIRLMDPPVAHTFFCYLDLFQVWHPHDPEPWIADMPDLARSLQRLVRDHAGGTVTFYPADPEGQVHVDTGNPLLEPVS